MLNNENDEKELLNFNEVIPIKVKKIIYIKCITFYYHERLWATVFETIKTLNNSFVEWNFTQPEMLYNFFKENYLIKKRFKFSKK